MPRRLRTALVFTILLGASLIALRLAAAPIFRHGLAWGLGRVCRECVFRFGETHFSFLGGELRVAHVFIQGDPSESPRYKILADQVTARLSWLSVLGLSPRIHALEVDGLLVQLVEREDTGPPSPPSYPFMHQLPRLRVEELHVRAAHFIYGREGKSGNGLVTFDDIRLDATAFGTKREISPPRFQFTASGHTLGNPRGRIRIEADVGLFEQTKVDSARIEVQDEAMGALNTFLTPIEGLRVGGRIIGGHVRLEIRDRDLELGMRMAYRDFSLDVQAKPGKRSRGAAWFQEAIGDLIVAPRLPKDAKAPWPATRVRAHQKTNDSVFLFILNGLKDGALGIVTGKAEVGP